MPEIISQALEIGALPMNWGRSSLHPPTLIENPLFLTPPPPNPMIRILTTAAVAAFALAATSCCCTSDSKPPGLRPTPKFKELESAYAAEPDPAPIRATK